MSIEWLADMYTQVQKIRVACDLRVQAWQRNDKETPTLFVQLGEKLKDIETQTIKQSEVYLEQHPAWPWLKQVKGLGPALSCKLLGYIGSISNFDTVSKLWRYSGLACIDGKAEKPKKGEKLHYNARLKSTMYLIGVSFLRARSPYRRVYDDAREYYTTNRPDWTKKHIHLAAMRKMEKVFLSHLWQVWREAEGLPTRREYVFEYLGHTTRYEPLEFIP